MNRRTFVRALVVGSGVTAVTPLLVPPQVQASAWSTVGELALDGLKWFASNIVAPVIVDKVEKWLDGDDQSPQQTSANQAVGEINQKGYPPQTYSPLYQCDTLSTPFFGVTAQYSATAQYNAFAPFIYPINNYRYGFGYIGGASLIGLGRYSADVSAANQRAIRNGTFDVGSYLVPQGPVNTCDCMYDFRHSWAANYPTQMGNVLFAYTAPYAESSWWGTTYYDGAIQIQPIDYHNNPILPSGAYPITYNQVFNT